MVEIEVVNRSGAELEMDAVADLARQVLAAEGVDEGELGLALVAPDEIRRLKRDQLGLDEETDALAFPIDGTDALPDGLPRQLGDVVLCPQVVGEAWRAPLVHAVLHLLGYDHGAVMAAREREYAE
jgi:probable rRNA maturation factor